MLRVAVDDLLALDVAEVVLEDLGAKQVYEGLDVGSHFLFIGGFLQLAEVDLREGYFEELDVESVSAQVKFEYNTQRRLPRRLFSLKHLGSSGCHCLGLVLH